jgi:hypothetical protein
MTSFEQASNGPGPRLMGADTLMGNDVYNRQDEDLGDIKEIMLDVAGGPDQLCRLVVRRTARHG